MNIQSRMRKRLPAVRRLTVVASVTGVISGVAIIVQALTLSQVIAGAFLLHATSTQELSNVFGFVGATAVRAAVIAAQGAYTTRAAAKVKRQLRADWLRQSLTNKVHAATPDTDSQRSDTQWVTAALIGVDRLETYLARYLPQAAAAGVIPAVLWLFILRLDWVSAALLAVAAPLLIFFFILVGKGANEVARRQWGLLTQLSARLLERIEGLQTLVLFRREGDAAATLRDLGDRYRRITMRTLYVAFVSSFVLELFATLSTAGVALALGLRLLPGDILFATALAVLILTPEFFAPIRALGAEFHAALDGLAAAEDLFTRLEEATPVAGSTPLPQPQAPMQTSRSAGAGAQAHTDRTPVSCGLTLREIWWRPQPAAPAILKGVSLDFPAGSRTAIIGPSGAGKSTLLSVLAGKIKPTAGAIERDSERYSVDSIDTAILHQRPHIFADTLRENLRLAAPDAADAQLLDILARVGLMEWYRQLAQGLETMMGSGGWPTSAGEAQRIAVARALLRNASLWLLDEPTAHLDPLAAARIVALILRVTRDQTLVWVTHDQREANRLDRVVHLQAGEVTATWQPSHSERASS
jgi:thiol reductant ABC exporter CydD subunit